MRNILILFAHPKFEHSEANQAMIDSISNLENIEIRDLYELYPDFNISIQEEQEALFQADVVIWHHPIYWYSCPPLLKQWIDLVLEFGWAYGPGGVYLKGKYLLNAVTSGGSDFAYSREGRNEHPLIDFLLPFEQTGKLCLMEYLAPFHLSGTFKITDPELQEKAKNYREFILELRDSETIQRPLRPSPSTI
ncbi:glutathione-regulated potassium-efflux system oxidoreductase KefF [Algoriphagus machipongonensis]|uniref:Glutathione-regulated potassium-efflux system ancillary protein KefF n=1 Tax=Algoriphagus machipongonensis TaxID=388413 RepID=A3HTD2_9BACT|nr:NAD(P)H-dependent oxidoreductase [Algoriphagus machipongonensis]EAZ83100.1 glutathione-regulated potassium-efflux system ancillary protein KefF [Algoriphagus machipongonensis]